MRGEPSQRARGIDTMRRACVVKRFDEAGDNERLPGGEVVDCIRGGFADIRRGIREEFEQFGERFNALRGIRKCRGWGGL